MFIKVEFNKKKNTDQFNIHLADLTQWCSGNPTIVDNICKKLFHHAQQVMPCFHQCPVLIHTLGCNAGTTTVESTS